MSRGTQRAGGIAPASAAGWLRRWWQRLVPGAGGGRRLRLCEVLPLGEQRWVGILACDGRQFLLGATRQHLAVLAELDAVTDTWLVHEGRRTAGREPS